MLARANQAAYLHARPTISLKPRLLLTGLSMIVMVTLLYWAVQRMSAPLNVPIDKIRVQGAFVHVTEPMLEPLSKTISGTGYFDLDVAGLQRQITALPWVKHATVRRVWPDTVAIHFVEQQPLAIWADGGIVNQQGELFAAQRSTYPKGLPVFNGPPAAEKKMVEAYQQFSKMLVPLGITISELALDERQAWRIDLRNDISLRLGRESVIARLKRFTAVYQKIKVIDSRAIKSIDLRYTNGLAMAWSPNEK